MFPVGFSNQLLKVDRVDPRKYFPNSLLAKEFIAAFGECVTLEKSGAAVTTTRSVN